MRASILTVAVCLAAVLLSLPIIGAKSMKAKSQSSQIRGSAVLATNEPIPGPGVGGGFGPEKVAQLAGYLDLPDHPEIHIFFWFFESRSDPLNDPLVLWLTGGPGCSSQLAMLTENGPYLLDAGGDLKLNPHSWNSKANVLWVDQPVGTGYSYSDESGGKDYVRSSVRAAAEMRSFLMAFFSKYQKYRDLDFFIFGESYAGHYIPALATAIQKGNTRDPSRSIRLKGVGIGNGWVDPEIQYKSWVTYAGQMHLVDDHVLDGLNETYNEMCLPALKQHDMVGAPEDCAVIVEEILEWAGDINPYDVREDCKYPPLCYNFRSVTDFLNRPDVKKALMVPQKVGWDTCDMAVHQVLEADLARNYETEVPGLLSDGVRVLIYHGDQDLLCNWIGGQEWVKSMPWPGQANFTSAAEKTWTVNGATAGYATNHGPLTFLRVKDAGHMVPTNQPARALDMLNRFLAEDQF